MGAECNLQIAARSRGDLQIAESRRRMIPDLEIGQGCALNRVQAQQDLYICVGKGRDLSFLILTIGNTNKEVVLSAISRLQLDPGAISRSPFPGER